MGTVVPFTLAVVVTVEPALVVVSPVNAGSRAAPTVPEEIFDALVVSVVADVAGAKPLIKFALIVPAPVGPRLDPVPTNIAAEVFVPAVMVLNAAEPAVPPLEPQVNTCVLVL